MFCGRKAPQSIVTRLLSRFGDLHSHKFMYDGPALIRLVEGCGFIDAKIRELDKSLIAEIQQVEMPGRVIGGAGVIVECRKGNK